MAALPGRCLYAQLRAMVKANTGVSWGGLNNPQAIEVYFVAQQL